jgi:SAM-dependent methyltransferase
MTSRDSTANSMIDPTDASLRSAYVPETQFGTWFQRTDIWRRYVVEAAVTELYALLPERVAVSSILEVGCGEGVAFDLLRRRFPDARLMGVDIDADSVAAARCTARQLGDIPVYLADASRLPLADGAADLIFCHQLLHHATDPARVLGELHRVLAPGGWLLVAESCRSFLEWWPVRWLFRHPPRVQHTAADYVALIGTAGFQQIAYSTPSPWWSEPDFGWRRRRGRTAYTEPTQVRIAACRSG